MEQEATCPTTPTTVLQSGLRPSPVATRLPMGFSSGQNISAMLWSRIAARVPRPPSESAKKRPCDSFIPMLSK